MMEVSNYACACPNFSSLFHLFLRPGNDSLSDARSVRRDPGPQIGAFFCYGTGDGRSLHFALVVDDDSSVILEVDKLSVFSSERLTLADDDCRHNFFAELRLALLDGGQNHVTAACCR